MRYYVDGKAYNITEKYIKNAIEHLGITREEAIQMYLEDEGAYINEEQEELEQKAEKYLRTLDTNTKGEY